MWIHHLSFTSLIPKKYKIFFKSLFLVHHIFVYASDTIWARFFYFYFFVIFCCNAETAGFFFTSAEIAKVYAVAQDVLIFSNFEMEMKP